MRVARSIGAWLVARGTATAAQAAPEGRFGWLGGAPGQAGQALQQAEAALGTALSPTQPTPKDTASCHLRSCAAPPGGVCVVQKGAVERMKTLEARYLKVEGLRAGDEVKKVRQACGSRLSVRLQAHSVVMLRGGMLPAVEFLEGCSG